MGLDVSRLAQFQPSLGVHMPDQALLRDRVGLAERGRAGVLVGRGAPHHGPDHVAVSDGGRDGLEHEGQHALAAAEAVGLVVEGLAGAVGGEHLQVSEHLEHARFQDQVGCCYEGLPVVGCQDVLATLFGSGDTWAKQDVAFWICSWHS